MVDDPRRDDESDGERGFGPTGRKLFLVLFPFLLLALLLVLEGLIRGR
jgi:hypothetical protein